MVGAAQAQTTLPLNDTWETSSLTSEDLIIPANATSLSIVISGGDGGRVQFTGNICNSKKILGGEGAAVSATFVVGDQDDMLKPGGRLRIFTGQAGGVDTHACIEGGNYSGGGGGASAVLYWPSSSPPASNSLWDLLAVAGGGGGANRPSAGITYKGKGANAEDTGDNVQSGIAKGGKNMGLGSEGRCADWTGGAESGYHGAAVFCDDDGETQNGRPMTVSSSDVDEGEDGKILSIRLDLEDQSKASDTGGTGGKANGGDGFTGGAAGAGGGGGGAGSSAGAGGTRTPGGGGGSWLTQKFQITESDKSSGGDGAGSGNHGFVQLTASLVPEAKCKSELIVNLDGSGNGQVSASDVDNGSTYPTGWKLQLYSNASSSIWPNPKSFNCSDAGTDYTVQMQLLDASGSFQDKCFSVIKLRDATQPQAWCVNPTIQLNDNGQATLTTNMVNSGSSDNCGGNNLTFQLSRTNFTCADAGQTREVTLSARDRAGNIGTCKSYVKVEDNITPVATCHANNIVLDAQNTDHEYNVVRVNSVEWQSFTVQQTGLLSSVDLKLASQDPPFVTFYYQLYIYEGEGTAGERLSRTTVEIRGLEENVSWVNLELDQMVYVESGRIYTIIIQPISGSLYWATDHNNPYSEGRNSNDLSHDYAFRTYINIVDAISAPLDANGKASITINQIDNGSSDNCAIASRTLSQSSFDCSDIGNNTITLTVTDNSGNSSFCHAVVTVEDNIAPVAKCKDVLIQLDNNGYAEFYMDLFDNGSSDACDIITREINWFGGGDLDCSHIGEHPLTMTLTDRNGNASSCNANLIVQDNMAPVVKCRSSADSPVLDAAFSATAVGLGFNESRPSQWQSFTAESSGILSKAEVLLLVAEVDSDPPEVPTVNPGTAFLSIKLYEGEDLSGAMLYSTSSSMFIDAFPAQWITLFSDANIPVVLGNKYTLVVEVLPNSVSPIIWSGRLGGYAGGRASFNSNLDFSFRTYVGPPVSSIAVQLDANGSASIAVDQIDDGSTDNCGIASRSLSQSSFSCSNLGDQIVTLTVTDVNGNISTCKSSVTVEDVSPPVVTCDDVTVELDETGFGFYQIQPNATDNCAIASTLGIERTVGCADVGSFTKTVDAWDIAGNQGSCTATVTVVDFVAPIAECKATSVNLDANGNAFITPDQIDDGSSDACGIGERSLDITDFSCQNLGTNTVVLTVKDVNGNQSQCTATVEVFDVTAPAVFAELIYVSGNANSASFEVDVAVDDICDIDPVLVSVMEIPEVGSMSVSYKTKNKKKIQISFEDHTVKVEAPNPEAFWNEIIGQGGIAVNDGQLVKLNRDEAQVYLYHFDGDELSKIIGPSFSLLATATDASGNTNSATDTPDFPGDASQTALTESSQSSNSSASSLPVNTSAQRNQKQVGDLQTYPNPFSNFTNIEFSLAVSAKTSIQIFNLQGQRVYHWNYGILDAGQYKEQWFGTDAAGGQLPSGLYLIQLQTSRETLVKKVSLQK